MNYSMGEKIKVTYAIPSYNHGPYIRNAIESILHQTYHNIEVIVCDDGSTDETDSILEEYQKKRKITYIRNEKNLGVIENLSRLIDQASGEYICFLASDDWIRSDKVEKQLKYMLENELDAVFSPVIKYFENTKEYVAVSGNEFVEIFKEKDGYLKHLYSTDSNGGLIQSGMFRTECVKKIGYLQGYKSDDWLFEIRFLQAGYKAGWMNENLTYYRIHGTNTHVNAMYCLQELELPVIRDFIPKQYQNTILANVYAEAALKLIDQKETKKSLSLQIKSLRYRITFQNVKRFFKADIRRILIKLNLYKLYWKLRYKTEL